MANITHLYVATYGKAVTDKLNEIIDWLNGITDADRVTNITVNNGTELAVTYINGAVETFNLPDTTYDLATAENNGLAFAGNVSKIDTFTQTVSALNSACYAIEKARQAVAEAEEARQQYENSGGGDNSGDGGGPGSGDSE